MSFIISIIELALYIIAALDTLSFVVSYKKCPEKSDVADYTRICYRWVFLLVLRSMGNLICCGFLGTYLRFASLVLKAYVTIPLLGGTDKLFHFLTQENGASSYVKQLVHTVRSKVEAKRE